MRGLIVLICFFNFLLCNSQTPKILSNYSKIDKDELIWAKENYLKMMQTNTYLEYRKSGLIYTQKLNGLLFPKGSFNFEEFITKNLSKTNFKTVDEALILKNSSVDLLNKLMQENKKLYDLMKNSSTVQLGEIMRPEREYYENLKHLSRR